MAKNSEKTQAEIYREQRKARLAKAAAKNQKKQTKVSLGKGAKAAIAVVVVLAIAAGILAYAASATGFKYKNNDVITIGDNIATVSAAEYSYYYNQAFNYYFQMSYQYESYGSGMGKMYTGYDYSVVPDEQAYSGKIEGIENPTWADNFKKLANDSIIQTKAFVKLAKDAGIELDDEDLKTIDENLDQIKETASSQNYSVTAYLQMYYGKGVTRGLVKGILEEQALASKYQQSKSDEFGEAKTDKEINKEYKSDKDAYDKVGLAYYLVNAETVTKKNDDGEETSAVTKKTMAAAKKKAEKIAAKASDYEAFSAAVDKAAGKEDSATLLKVVDNSTLSQYVGSSYISQDVVDWIYGGAKAGQTKVFEKKDAGYYVCFAVAAPYRDDVKPVSVRHILIKFKEDAAQTSSDAAETTQADTTPEIKESEGLPALADFKDAPVYNTVTADKAKDAKAYNEAEILLREYLNGEKSEKSFADLATKYSEDTASTTESEHEDNGGLYENVAVGDMVDEFNDWIFDEKRKAGDVGIVETTYGYHIMYFVSTAEEPKWKSTIRDSLAQEDLNKLIEDTLADETYKITVTSEKYIADVTEQTMDLARNFIHNIQNNTSSDGHNH